MFDYFKYEQSILITRKPIDEVSLVHIKKSPHP